MKTLDNPEYCVQGMNIKIQVMIDGEERNLAPAWFPPPGFRLIRNT